MAIKKRERLLLLVTAGVLVFFAGDRFVIEPLITDWKDRSAELTELRLKIQKGEALLQHKDSLHRHWKEMEQRSLPADRAKAENRVLAGLNSWAHNSGLTLADEKPRWVEDEETGDRLEVRLAATGNLQAITQFLYELEHDPMAIRFEDVEIRARDEKGSDLSLEARFSGVVLKESQS